MSNNNRNITINIGPQSSEAWFFIAFSAAAIAFFVFAVPHIKDSNNVEIAKIQANAEIEKAKFEAQNRK